MDVLPLDPQVLGRLLVIPSMLNVLPNNGAIARFLYPALCKVPGVKDLVLCLGEVVYPDRHASCCDCPAPQQFPVSSDQPLPVCPLCDLFAAAGHQQQIFLRTAHACYGYLNLLIGDRQQFAPYESHLDNLVNIMAMLLENKQFTEDLNQKNRDLQDLLAHLEVQVAERTKELTTEIQKRNILEEQIFDSESQLLANQERLIQSQLIAKMGDFVWEIATEKITWSEGLYRLLNYDLEQPEIDLKFMQERIYHPDDRPLIQQWFTAGMAAQQEELQPREYRLVCRDGTVIDVQTNVQIKYRDGEPDLVIGTCLDITERKRFEESLKDYQRVVAATDDAICLLDRHYRYRLVNGAYREAFLQDDREIIGCLPTMVFGEEMFNTILKPKYERCLQGQTENYQQWFDLPRLGRRFCDVVYSPYFTDETSVEGIIVNVRDITALKLIEEALRESEAKFRLVTETIRDVFWVCAADFSEVIYVSPAYGEIWGRSPEKLYENPLSFIEGIHPDYLNHYQAILEGYFRQGKAYECEYPLVQKNGELRWIYERGYPLTQLPGQRQLMVGVCTDITDQRQAREAQYASEQRWRTLAENSPDCIMTLNQNHEVMSINKTFRGLAKTEILGQPLPQFSPDCATAIATLLDRVLATGASASYETAYHDPAGNDQYFESRVVPIQTQQGKGLLVTATDITTRKQAESKQQLLASVFFHAREGILITDAAANIVDVNQAFIELTGYSREEVIGHNPRLLKSGMHDQHFYQEMWGELLTRGCWKGEIWNRRKNGELYAEILTISEIRDVAGNLKHYVALFSDITAQKRHQQQLEHIAHYDTLTSLPNRLLLGDRLNQSMITAINEDRHLAVVYLDLDGFKEINDTYGHDVGDQLLMAIAKRMKHSLRRDDTIARLGGDEFVAVLMDLADLNGGSQVFERLLQAAAQPIQIGTLTVQVSASLGITFYPQLEPVDADQLLRQADQAMYQAKVTGKNRYHIFDLEQDQHIRGYHKSLDNIRQAIANREFVLFYQPKVNMRTGAILGAEALIRWQHPEEGLLSPAVFLPIIENHPLSIELGEWILATAVAQLDQWHSNGLIIPISVNISAIHLQNGNFMTHLRSLLAQYPQIHPQYLELEVLETSALEELDQVSQIMNECRELGIRFALDDFGTGYSSLTYLKHLPAHQLKIDQSFVYDMIKNPEDIAILRSILDLATALHRQVIAEGVETLAHGQILLKLGCELGQGYSIARPMEATEFLAWSQAWQPDPLWQNESLLNYNDFSLFLALVEEDAWFQNLASYLNGHLEASHFLPEGDHCAFCEWFAQEKDHHHRGSQRQLQRFHQWHQEVHQLTREILTLYQQGQPEVAIAKFAHLRELRDKLQLQLQTFAQSRDLHSLQDRLQRQFTVNNYQ